MPSLAESSPVLSDAVELLTGVILHTFPPRVVSQCEEMVSRFPDLASSTANFHRVHQVHHPDANLACAQAMSRLRRGSTVRSGVNLVEWFEWYWAIELSNS